MTSIGRGSELLSWIPTYPESVLHFGNRLFSVPFVLNPHGALKYNVFDRLLSLAETLRHLHF